MSKQEGRNTISFLHTQLIVILVVLYFIVC